MDLRERECMCPKRAREETYGGERCEGGMKITQFVLSSWERRMHDESGRGEKDRERKERTD